MVKRERLFTLDAMRGVAAILVVMYHFADVAFPVAPSGYLAVDFFFALSGLVIASNYESRLRGALTASRFMLERLIRLWPMFIVGVGFAAVKCLGQIAAHDDKALTLSGMAVVLATEVFMLPSPVGSGSLFPMNGPAWSLFFELVINGAFAVLLFRFRKSWLCAAAGLGALLVIPSTLKAGGMNVGWEWDTAIAGLGRVLYSFTIGILLYRAGVTTPRRRGWMMALPIAALVALLVLPVAPAWRLPFDLTVAWAASPLLLILGARWQAPKWLEKPCEILGDLSYPLYAVHFPLVFIAGFVARKLHLPAAVWAPGFMVAVVLLAYGLGRWVDPWARQTLKTTLRRPAIATA